MNLNDADRKKLATMLDQLGKAVEDLLLTGLTTASETTRQTLNVAFQEASRLKLLRLGGTLRVANEELGRFTRNDPEFSRSRFSFFINRAWMLGKGLARALKANDNAAFDQLNWTAAQVPIKALEVVTLGVSKKVISRLAVLFDFYMRAVNASEQITKGQRLVWSCLFEVDGEIDGGLEMYLERFWKSINIPAILQGNITKLENVAVSVEQNGQARVFLSKGSIATAGKPVSDWSSFQQWDVKATLHRLQKHVPGPFDLETETQEEVFLENWSVGSQSKGVVDNQALYPIMANGIQFFVPVRLDVEGKTLTDRLRELAKEKVNAPLFAIMHYEKCKLMLQPLAIFEKDGPVYLQRSRGKVDRKSLVKGMKF